VLFAYHEMGYVCMDALIRMGAPIAALYTHRDAPGEQIWWRSCAELARTNSIPVHTPEKIDGEWIAKIGAIKPAVIYSFNYRELLPEALLQLAPLGAFNLHGALLPRYRGRAPINWMLVNGEGRGGVTLHHMVARADAGDIVAQREVEITDDDTALTLYHKITPLGVEIIHEYHPLIVAGRAPRRPQDLSAGTYFGRRRPEDGRIDWNWPARQIFNRVRAVTHPYPGAFCFVDGRKLFIWRARVAREVGTCAHPGAIVQVGPDGAVEIASGHGSLLLMSVQFDTETEQAAANAFGAIMRRREIRLE
jgi:methionyl-tRNA formyltransferase